jgi:hypothetical protein
MGLGQALRNDPRWCRGLPSVAAARLTPLGFFRPCVAACARVPILSQFAAAAFWLMRWACWAGSRRRWEAYPTGPEDGSGTVKNRGWSLEAAICVSLASKAARGGAVEEVAPELFGVGGMGFLMEGFGVGSKVERDERDKAPGEGSGLGWVGVGWRGMSRRANRVERRGRTWGQPTIAGETPALDLSA